MKRFFRAAVGLGLLAGFPLLAGIAAALLVLLAVALLEAHAGSIVVAPLALAALAAYVGIRVLKASIRAGAEVPQGLELGAADQPALWAAVRSLAAEIGSAPPDRILLATDVDASVVEATARLGLARGTRTLLLGAPLLLSLSRGQLTAVLASELGRVHGGRTWLRHVLADLGVRRPLGRLVGLYGRCYLRLTSGMEHHQDDEADAMAAEVAGRDPLTSALREIPVAALAWQALARDYLAPAAAIGLRPRLVAEGYLNLLDDPERRRAFDAARQHPSDPELVARIHRLAELPAHRPSVVDPDADPPAYALLVEPDRTLDRFFDEASPHGLEEASWTQLGTALGLHRAHSSARTLVRRLDSYRASHPERRSVGRIVTFDDVILELREGRGVALAPDAPDTDESARRAWAIDLVAGLLGAELTNAGRAAYQLDWSGLDLLLDRQGRVLDVRDLAQRVVDGDGLDDLSAFLEEEGIGSSEPLDYPEPRRRAQAVVQDTVLGCIGPLRKRGRAYAVLPCSHGLVVLRLRGVRELATAISAPMRTGNAERLSRRILRGPLAELEGRPGALHVPWPDLDRVEVRRRPLRSDVLEVVPRGGERLRLGLVAGSGATTTPYDAWSVLRHYLGSRLVLDLPRRTRSKAATATQTDSKASVAGP